ncbi:MAG: hypothetical protein ACKV2T_25315 [Kofleriaceae bacterium]
MRGLPLLDALHTAVQFDDPKVVERLIARGADPTAKLAGKTSLEVAQTSNAKKVLPILTR